MRQAADALGNPIIEKRYLFGRLEFRLGIDRQRIESLKAGRRLDAFFARHVGGETGRGGVVVNCRAVAGHKDHLALEPRRDVALWAAARVTISQALSGCPAASSLRASSVHEQRIVTGARVLRDFGRGGPRQTGPVRALRDAMR